MPKEGFASSMSDDITYWEFIEIIESKEFVRLQEDPDITSALVEVQGDIIVVEIPRKDIHGVSYIEFCYDRDSFEVFSFTHDIYFDDVDDDEAPTALATVAKRVAPEPVPPSKTLLWMMDYLKEKAR